MAALISYPYLWQSQFTRDQLRAFWSESLIIRKMECGKERRKRLLNLLSKGFRITLNHSAGGGWNSKDLDIKYLIKKGKVKAYKELSPSFICPYRSFTVLGINK